MLLLLLPVLLGIAAIVIDGAHAFGEKRRTQNAADAAALGAAQNLLGSAPGSCPDGSILITDVGTAAECYSAVNHGPSSLPPCPSTPSPLPWPPQDPSQTNCYQWPYKGDNQRVEVRITRSIDGYFLNVIGLGGLLDQVSARAVASAQPETAETSEEFTDTETVNQASTSFTEATSTSFDTVTNTTYGGSPAVFTGNPNCSGISYRQTNGPTLFQGGIISNGSINISFSNPFAPGTGASSYGGPHTGAPSDPPCNASAQALADPDATLTRNNPTGVAWPIGWDPSLFTEASVLPFCTVRAPASVDTGTWTLTVTSGSIASGIYCARRTDGTSAGAITVNGSGTITVVAPTINLGGANRTWASHPSAPQHLLFFATGGSQAPAGNDNRIITTNGPNSFSGVIYAPYGTFRMSNGGTSTAAGSILAWAVDLTGSGASFTGDYAPVNSTSTTTTIPTGTYTTTTPTGTTTTPIGTNTYTSTVTHTVTTGTTPGLDE